MRLRGYSLRRSLVPCTRRCDVASRVFLLGLLCFMETGPYYILRLFTVCLPPMLPPRPRHQEEFKTSTYIRVSYMLHSSCSLAFLFEPVHNVQKTMTYTPKNIVTHLTPKNTHTRTHTPKLAKYVNTPCAPHITGCTLKKGLILAGLLGAAGSVVR